MKALGVGGAACLLLSFVLQSCVSVSEDMFFAPPTDSTRAATLEAMRFDRQEQITGLFDRLGRRDTRLPMTIKHQFADLGGEHIAVSQVVKATAKAEEPLIVHCGGNARDRFNSGMIYSAKVAPWGEALLFDYPGYGDSTGKPTVAAFGAVLADLGPWLDARAKGRPLVVWGHSIGGLICAKIVSLSREVDAIILETSGLSPVAMARNKAAIVPFLNVSVKGGFEAYDIGELLKGFDGPVMVVGAGKDQTLPVVLSRDLAKMLKEGGRDTTYVEIAEAGHTNADQFDAFTVAAKAFFSRVADTRH